MKLYMENLHTIVVLTVVKATCRVNFNILLLSDSWYDYSPSSLLPTTMWVSWPRVSETALFKILCNTEYLDNEIWYFITCYDSTSDLDWQTAHKNIHKNSVLSSLIGHNRVRYKTGHQHIHCIYPHTAPNPNKWISPDNNW